VTTLAEVKEQVLKYIPVMARPMVMYRDKHPIQWTGVYADIEVSFFMSMRKIS
jgi:voltage-dependent calcium channel alpha-2/delta-3